MQKLKLGMLALAIAIALTESSSFAQIGGIGGGIGGGTGRPKHKLHKSRAPALSPALNLIPGAAQSFEGQFLLRQLPQEQAIRNSQQTGKALDTLQREISQKDNQIRTGVRSTGHRTQFMSYGSYYPGSRSGGR